MPATDDESATRPRPAAQSPVHPNELIDPNEHGAKNPARVDITETHVRSSGSSAAFLVAALLLAAMGMQTQLQVLQMLEDTVTELLMLHLVQATNKKRVGQKSVIH